MKEMAGDISLGENRLPDGSLAEDFCSFHCSSYSFASVQPRQLEG